LSVQSFAQNLCDPPLDLGEDQIYICNQDSYVIEGPDGFTAYEWTSTELGGPVFTQDLTVTANGKYNLEVYDAVNDCSSFDFVYISFIDVDIPDPEPVEGCDGDSFTFTGPSIEFGTSYFWSDENGDVIVNGQTITVSESGDYTYNAIDYKNCGDAATYSVTIHPNPVVSVDDVGICQSDLPATLSATPGFVNYQWSNGAFGQTIDVFSAGTYDVTVTDANGCQASASATVTVFDNPSISLESVVLCDDEVPATIAGPDGFVSYDWSNGDTTQDLVTSDAGNYTLIVTDANGCQASASATVTINPSPTITLDDVTVCADELPVTLTAPFGFQSYTWSTGSTSQSIIVTESGNYTVTGIDFNGCDASGTSVVTVNPNPEFTLENVTICAEDAPATVDGPAGFTTYAWSDGQDTQTASFTQSGVYTLTVTDANGCSGSASTVVTVNPEPSFALQDVEVCDYQTPVTINGPFGFASYFWSNGETTQNIQVTESGVYTLTAVDANGCDASASSTVTVNVAPSISLDDITVCDNGQPVDLSAPAGFDAYFWSTGSTSQTIQVFASGVYNVTVTDANGCQASTSATVTINPNPNIALQNVVVCDDQTPVTIFGPAGFAAYSWSNGADTQDIAVSESGVYTLTVTDANGCQATASATATVNISPVISVDDVTLCESDLPATLTGPAGFAQYQWSNGAGSQSIIVFQEGTYTLTVVDFNGCDASTSATVTINPDPQFTLESVVICAEDSPAVIDGPAGFDSYSWSTGENTEDLAVTESGIYTLTVTDENGCSGTAAATVTINAEPSFALQNVEICDYQAPATLFGPFGFVAYNWSNGETTQNIQVSASGQYCLTVVDINGCDATACANVTINAAPVISLDDVTVCDNGEAVTLTAPAGFASYFWSTGATSQSIQVVASGVYNVTVTDANGCQGSATSVVTINPNPTIALQSVEVCEEGTPVTVFGPAGFVTYAWSNGGDTQNIQVSESGVYSLTVTDINGCQASATATVTVNPEPTISVDDVTLCESDLPATLIGPAGFAQYQWSNGAGSQNITVFQSGVYTLTVVDANGCDATTTATVTVNPNPQFGLTNVTICADDAPAVVDGPSGFDSYQWSNGTNGEDLVTSESGVYTLTVVDVNGCSSSATVIVNINPEPTFALQDVEVCSYEAPVTVFGPAGFVNYQWDNGAFTQNLQVNESGVYCLTVVDFNGCDATACATVTINPAPSIELADITVCDDQAPVTIQGPAGFAQYQWSNGSNAQSIIVNASGVYTLTVTDENGCQDSATSLVTINPSPQFSLPDVEACADETPVTLFGPAGFVSYQWSNDLNTQNISVTESGVYTLTVTDINGCTGTAVSVVTINEVPQATLEDVTVCADDLPAVIFGPAGFVSYQWSNGAGSQNITVFQTGTYSVTFTDINGCTGTASANVIVNEEPTIVVDDITVCEDDIPVTLDGPSGFVSYLWSTGDITEDLTTSNPGVYFLTVTDENGCTATAAATVSILQNPDIELEDIEICENDLPLMLQGPVGFVFYNWSTGETSQNIFITEAGTYCVTVTDNKGCTDTACSTVTVNGVPEFELDDVTVCEDDAPAVVTAPAGFVSYLWSNGSIDEQLVTSIPGVYTLTVFDENGCSSTSQFVVAINQNPIFALNNIDVCGGDDVGTIFGPVNYIDYNWFNEAGETVATTQDYDPTEAGVYCLTVTDANGCMSTECATVVIGDVIAFDLEDVEICDSEIPATLNGPDGFVSYFWSNGATTQSINVGLSGVYVLTVFDAEGCSASADAVVTINPSPAFTLQDVTICAEDGPATLTAPAGFVSYIWSNDATGSSTDVNESGIYSVTVVDVNGCSGSAFATVTINNAAEFTLEDISICEGNEATVFAPGGYTAYTWTNADGVIVGTSSSFATTEAGTYTVTVVDVNGCTYSTDATITIADDIVFELADVEICDGDVAMLIAPAGFTSYVWTTGATSQNIEVSDEGIYCVTVSDANGCSGEACATVTVNQAGPIDGFLVDVDACPVDVVFLEGPDGFETYTWTCNGEVVSTEQTLVSTTSCVYELTVTDANGCSATDDVVVEFADDIIIDINVECNDVTGEATLSVDVLQGVADENGNYQISIDGAENVEFTGTYQQIVTVTGIIAVEVTDATGCSTIQAATIPECNVIEDDGLVGDTVFWDDNGNGVQDEGEIGIEGVTVYLIDADGNIIDSTETDENGNYNFTDLPYGDYSVQVEVSDVPGFVLTTNEIINVPVDADNPINLIGDFGFVACEFAIAQTSVFCQNAIGLVTVEFSIANDDGNFAITSVEGGEFISYIPEGDGTTGILTIDVDLDSEFLGFYTIHYTSPCGPGELASSVSCQSVTAIELIEFNGRAEGEDNFLYWTTATEFETDYFVLERSADGINFEEVALINAIGFSTTEVTYNYLDTDVEAGQTFFYRLAEVTTDGKMEYVSDIVEIARDLAFSISHVYPTVATDNVTIDVISPVETTLTVMVYGADGRLMDIQNNTLEGSTSINLDVTNYTSGTYFIRINDGKTVESTKFIKH